MPRTMYTSNLVLVLSVCFFISLEFRLLFPCLSSPFGLIGCGLWHPEAEPLGLLREDIDENADQWKDILRAPAMRQEFLGGVADDDEAVVKAFTHHNKESALKTKPKVSSHSFSSAPALDYELARWLSWSSWDCVSFSLKSLDDRPSVLCMPCYHEKSCSLSGSSGLHTRSDSIIPSKESSSSVSA